MDLALIEQASENAFIMRLVYALINRDNPCKPSLPKLHPMPAAMHHIAMPHLPAEWCPEQSKTQHCKEKSAYGASFFGAGKKRLLAEENEASRANTLNA